MLADKLNFAERLKSRRIHSYRVTLALAASSFTDHLSLFRILLCRRGYISHLSISCCGIVSIANRSGKTQGNEVYPRQMLEIITISEKHVFHCLNVEALLVLAPIDNVTFGWRLSLFCWHSFLRQDL